MSSFRRASFLVRPVEAMHFGPPRSFTAGESHHRKTVFPLSSTTFQGLVRTKMLTAVSPPVDLNDRSPAARTRIEKLVGRPDALPSDWQLEGPWPVAIKPADEWEEEDEWSVPWVTIPRFLFESGSGRAPLHARIIRSTHPWLSDKGADHPLAGRAGDGAVHSLKGWIDPHNLEFALAGEEQLAWQPQGYTRELPPFIEREQHPGLAINRGRSGENGNSEDTGTAAPGMLYLLERLRFRWRSGFAGELSGLLPDEIPADALTNGVGVVGRQSRFVAFDPLPPFHPVWRRLQAGAHLKALVRTGRRSFWLVAMTPAALGSPQQPELRGVFLPQDDGVRLVIRTALIGPLENIGGYLIATGESRPNRSYVPAGSCWLIELQGGDEEACERVLRSLHNRHVLGVAEEARFGYGLTFVGAGPLDSGR